MKDQRGSRRRNEHTLAEALGHLVDRYGMRERMHEERLRARWEEVVGAMVARHTVELRLRKGRLQVRVDSAPLRHELGFMRGDLMDRLNAVLEAPVVTEVVLA